MKENILYFSYMLFLPHIDPDFHLLYFPHDCRTFSNLSGSACLLVINSFSFHRSEDIFILPLFFKYISAAPGILDEKFHLFVKFQ